MPSVFLTGAREFASEILGSLVSAQASEAHPGVWTEEDSHQGVVLTVGAPRKAARDWQLAGYLCVGDPARVLEPADVSAQGRTAGPGGGAGSGAGRATAVGGEAGATAGATRCALRAFGVAPQFRRTGVATDLWRAALSSFPATISSVDGCTCADLAAALAWYGARGFDPASGSADPAGPTDPADANNLVGPANCKRRFTAAVETLRENLRDAVRT